VQVAAVFALAALLGVSVLYDSAHIAASLRRHGGGPTTYAKLSSSDDGATAVSGVARVGTYRSCSCYPLARSVG
jgi:hypothetical protein